MKVILQYFKPNGKWYSDGENEGSLEYYHNKGDKMETQQNDFQLIIPVNQLTIEEAKRDYPALFFTFQQHFSMGDENTAKMVSITVGTCHYCWERPAGCRCWDDS